MLPDGTLENQNYKSELEFLMDHLKNVFEVIIDEAIDMKKRELKTKSKSEDATFETGCIYGYYRVLSLIKMHAESTSIPLSIFSLDKYDIDKELL